MNLYQYEGKIVRVIDVDGRNFTGVAVSFPAEYGYHEFCRDEESVKIEGFQLLERWLFPSAKYGQKNLATAKLLSRAGIIR